MTRRCSAHIWCGGSTAYINALRMGDSDLNVGLVLTRGALESYSIEDCVGNNREKIILNSSFFALTGGEEHIIEWELFPHSGKVEFASLLRSYPHTLYVETDHFTVYEHDSIRFTVEGADLEMSITCRGEQVPFERKGGKLLVSYQPAGVGEYRFDIVAGENRTYAEFCVVESLAQLIERRLHFIVDRQQYHNESSPLHGAFLIYDTKEKHPVFDGEIGDHNACHERIGMALLLIKYLQTHENREFRQALDLYVQFVLREFYDDETGMVFGDIGKYNRRVRLYDAPWIIRLFSELYTLTGEHVYADRIAKTVQWYYEMGGSHFYPNGISFVKIMDTLRQSGHPEADKIFDLLKVHAETIIEKGVYYPKHEVNYEQTVVTPAVTHICEMGMLTGEERYTKEAAKHIVNLERFSGQQPSFHLQEIPIRYWDDFWFGKALIMGDTFPHYWSCLTARSYFAYYRLSGEGAYLKAGRECIRNCLCLFSADGGASCAYVYPYTVGVKRGQFYDEWANDQDFALYFMLDLESFL